MLLWFQLAAGMVLLGENLFHLRVTRGNWNPRDLWGLLIATALSAIPALELFFIAYRWAPEAVLWPLLFALDLLALLLYTKRVVPLADLAGTAHKA